MLYSEALLVEQRQLLGDDLSAPVCYEHLRDMKLLDSVVRETLRLRPPIITAMRKVQRPITVAGGKYVIPAGNYLGSSPALTQLDEAHFKNPLQFNPTRWMSTTGNPEDEEAGDDKTGDNVDFGFGNINLSGARNPYLPFGAGKQRLVVVHKSLFLTMIIRSASLYR
jgi:sterol 14-demethylase